VRTTWAVLFLNTVTAWTMCWEASMVMIEGSPDALGVVTSADLVLPDRMETPRRRDKRDMSWFVKNEGNQLS